MKFNRILFSTLLDGLLVLSLASCGPATGASTPGGSSAPSVPLSQSSTPSSSSATASQSSDETGSGPDALMQPSMILALGDPRLLFPSNAIITPGTQNELNRWNDLIGAGKVVRIDVCDMNDTESELSRNMVSGILKTLMGAELRLYDTLGNPMTGGSFHVVAYDASGAILFRSSFDGEWFSVVFGEENTAYVFNGEGSSLDKLSEYIS